MMAPTKRRRPSELGTVRQLPSGRFQASYRLDGRTYTAPHTFTDRAVATAWLARERADRATGAWEAPTIAAMTLAAWASAWLASRADLAPATVKLLRHSLDVWVLPELGDIALPNLTPTRIRAWWADLGPRTEAAATRTGNPDALHGHPARVWARANGMTIKDTGRIPADVLTAWRKAQRAARVTVGTDRGPRPGATAAANAYRALRACLNAAVRDGLLTSCPCTVEGAGTVTTPERTPATPDEVARMADMMPGELRAALLVAAWGGLRFGELFGLARKHVDLERGSLRVQRALDRNRQLGPTKTASSVRTVFLPRFVADELAAHMARYTGARPDALLFTAATGSPVRQDYVTRHFRRAARGVGRDDLRWHDLRHTGATLAYNAGGTIRDVQRRLGHATARAALIYAHAADEGDRHLADRLDAAYRPATAPDTPPPAPTPAQPVANDAARRDGPAPTRLTLVPNTCRAVA